MLQRSSLHPLQTLRVSIISRATKTTTCSFFANASVHCRFSEVRAMQVVDAATTMGLLFGAMGVGAFIGPVGFNMFTPPKCATR